MAGDYNKYRMANSDKSANLAVTTATDDTTLITARSANHQIFIQRIIVTIAVYAAKVWTFTDSTGTPIPFAIISIPAAAVALASESNAYMTIDFGPAGYPLAVGKNLVLDVSATGAAGAVHVEAYEKLRTDAPVALAATN